MQLERSSLAEFHGHLDSVRWRLTGAGLQIEGDRTPIGSGGPPVTVKRIWDSFGDDILDAAKTFDVPFELIVATIATESRGNPNAERTEPGFVSYEATPSRVSIGLMQTLISTARSSLPGTAIDANALRDPKISIRAGAAYIARQAAMTGGDPPKVACAYNAGGVYAENSPANRWRMRQFPIGTSAHADRFVGWFNDVFIMLPAPTGFGVPSLIDSAASWESEQ
jgi:hypothetical protein